MSKLSKQVEYIKHALEIINGEINCIESKITFLIEQNIKLKASICDICPHPTNRIRIEQEKIPHGSTGQFTIESILVCGSCGTWLDKDKYKCIPAKITKKGE